MAAREHDDAVARARALRARTVEAARAAVVRLAPRREELRRRARWMTELLVRYFGFGEAFCAILDGEALRVRASSNERAWTSGLAIDLALCRDVMETGSALLVPDLASLGASVSDAGGAMLRFFACVPLLSGRVAIGTFCFVDSAPRHFGADGYSVLEMFGRRGSQLLSGGESQTEELWSPSGLLSREGLCVLLSAELSRLSSETLSLGVFAFDGRAPAWPAEERTAIAELAEGRFAALVARASDGEARRSVIDFVAAFARSDGFVSGGLVSIEDCTAWSFQPRRILLAAEALLERALRDRPGTIERIVIRREPLAIEGAAP